MMMFPEAMRLPFTFGLSGALHVAALSNLALPLPNDAYVSRAPLQVRLQRQRTVPASRASLVNISDPEVNPHAAKRVALHAVPTQTRAARVVPATLVRAVAPPLARTAAVPPAETQIEAKAIFVEHAKLGSAGADTSVPALANAAETHAGESGAAVVGGGQTSAVGDQDPVPAEPDGTIESPFKVPKALYSPLRKYPEEARWENRTGQGSLGFRLKPDGSVDPEIKVLRSSGHPDLDATAVKSLRAWRFVLPPGAAPSYWYRYPFRFGIS